MAKKRTRKSAAKKPAAPPSHAHLRRVLAKVIKFSRDLNSTEKMVLDKHAATLKD